MFGGNTSWFLLNLVLSFGVIHELGNDAHMLLAEFGFTSRHTDILCVTRFV